MTIITTLGFVMIIGFIVLGVVASIAALGVITQFVVTNRRERLARHESLRAYYGSFALAS